jgi:hypothetical protein
MPEGARRLLAVLGAVALVVVAIVVRGLIDGDDANPSDDQRGQGDGQLVVVCATELLAHCRALDGVTVIEEGASDTAAALVDRNDDVDTQVDVDAWITTSAWTEVVSSRRPGVLGAAEAVGTSPVVVAVDPARTGAVEAMCGAQALWRCLGDRAGAGWGDLGGDPRGGSLKTGLPRADTALGLPVLASVAAGFFGGTDFASNDFDAQGLPSWVGSLTGPSGAGDRDPIGTLVTRKGTYSAVGTLQALTAGRAADALAPEPTVPATVVVARVAGGDDVGDVDALRASLEAAGWDAAAGPPRATLKPGVMAALHTLWTENAR